MSQWLWVSEGHSRVDTGEIISAAGHAQSAVECAQSAMYLLAEPSFHAFAGAWGAAVSVPGAAPAAAASAHAERALSRARRDVEHLARCLQDYADWLTQASLIYAGAEGGAVAYTQACQVLEALGCSFAATSGSGFQWRTGLGLVTLLPGVIGEFQAGGLPKGHVPRGALTLQAALGDVTGGERGLASSAVGVARWWNDVGAALSGKSSGVVVTGPDGRSAWGTPTMVALGVQRYLPADGEPSDPRVTGALNRAQGAKYSRSSPTAMLAQLGLDSAGAPLQKRGQTGATNLPSEFRLGSNIITTPAVPAALLARVAASGSASAVGEVQILRHTRVSPVAPGGEPAGDGKKPPSKNGESQSWSVVVRGTQEWAPGSSNPQDMQSNLEAVGRRDSDQEAAVRLAMDLAGVQPGDPVEFVGHSQGGAIALNVAQDLEGADYNVVAVLTAGSPTGGLAADLQAPVLNLENLSDVVPSLDGSSATSANATSVFFDARHLPGSEKRNAHSLETYVAAAARADAEKELNPMAARVGSWGQARAQALGLDGQTRTEALYYRTTRAR